MFFREKRLIFRDPPRPAAKSGTDQEPDAAGVAPAGAATPAPGSMPAPTAAAAEGLNILKQDLKLSMRLEDLKKGMEGSKQNFAEVLKLLDGTIVNGSINNANFDQFTAAIGQAEIVTQLNNKVPQETFFNISQLLANAFNFDPGQFNTLFPSIVAASLAMNIEDKIDEEFTYIKNFADFKRNNCRLDYTVTFVGGTFDVEVKLDRKLNEYQKFHKEEAAKSGKEEKAQEARDAEDKIIYDIKNAPFFGPILCMIYTDEVDPQTGMTPFQAIARKRSPWSFILGLSGVVPALAKDMEKAEGSLRKLPKVGGMFGQWIDKMKEMVKPAMEELIAEATEQAAQVDGQTLDGPGDLLVQNVNQGLPLETNLKLETDFVAKAETGYSRVVLENGAKIIIPAGAKYTVVYEGEELPGAEKTAGEKGDVIAAQPPAKVAAIVSELPKGSIITIGAAVSAMPFEMQGQDEAAMAAASGLAQTALGAAAAGLQRARTGAEQGAEDEESVDGVDGDEDEPVA